ncbi:MAG: hypothetical protein IJN90_08255, partial [Bacilli bacterium]|nr:hypothetical protein [Bacilli bacterium]
GDTVLGTARTDVTGLATLNYTWEDSDIFNVSASYSSISDDLTMFVKDKNNLLSFNTWSGSDYSKTANYINKSDSVSISSSALNHYIGERSFLVNIGSATGYQFIDLETILECSQGDKFTLSARILSLMSCYLTIMEIRASPYAQEGISVIIQPSDSFQEYNISHTLSLTGDLYVGVRIASSSTSGVIYIDDIKLIKEE